MIYSTGLRCKPRVLAIFSLLGRHSLQSLFLSIQQPLFIGWLGGQARNLMASSFIANIVNGL